VENQYSPPYLADFVFGPRLGKGCRPLDWGFEV